MVFLRFLFLFLLLYCSSCSKKTLKRSETIDLNKYTIVISSNAIKQDSFSATYLKKIIKQKFNVDIKIAKNQKNTNRNIYIGKNSFLEQKHRRILSQLDAEDFAIQVDSHKNIYLFGGKKRSSSYAVFSFIENELGLVNFYEEEFYNSRYNINNIKVRERIESPAFSYRSNQFKGSVHKHFSTFNKLNPIFYKHLNYKEIGGNESAFQNCGLGHTFDCMVPIEKYYKSNPEYFSVFEGMDINHYSGQLCLSNDTVFNLIKKCVVETMNDYPENSIFNISPNDRDGTCECLRCEKVNMEEGSKSGTLVRFMNRISKEFINIYPYLKWYTLSYLDTAFGPNKTKLNKSVYICISTDTITWYSPFSNIRDSKVFKKRIDTWKRCTENILIYDYSCNFLDYFKFYPDIYKMSDNIKYYNEIGCKGLLIESVWENYNTGDSELKSFVYAKLMWDPNQNVQQLVSDFNKYYYGEVASKYVNRIYDIIYDSTQNLGYYSDFNIMNSYNCNVIQEINKALTEISDLRLTDIEKRRINKWRISVLYSLIKYKNDCLEPKLYKEFTLELEKLFKVFNVVKLSNFNNKIEEFIRNHKIKSEYLTNSKTISRTNIKNEASFDATNFIIVNEDNNNNFYPSIIKDIESSNGLAVNLPAKSGDWLVRFDPEEHYPEIGNAKIIKIRIKANKTNNEGWGVVFGCYNKTTKKHEFEHHIPLDILEKTYKEFEFDVKTLNKQIVFYIVAIPNENVQSLIIDTITFINQ